MKDKGAEDRTLRKAKIRLSFIRLDLLVVSFFNQLVDEAGVDERCGVCSRRLRGSFFDRLERGFDRFDPRPGNAVGPTLELVVGVFRFVAGPAEILHHDLDGFILLIKIKLLRLGGCSQKANDVVAVAFQIRSRHQFAVLLPGIPKPGRASNIS